MGSRSYKLPHLIVLERQIVPSKLKMQSLEGEGEVLDNDSEVIQICVGAYITSKCL
jgi:hypothetical protein